MTKPTEMMMRTYATELMAELQSAREKAKSGSALASGQKIALYEALSVLVNKAKAFGVPLAYLGLEGVNPDMLI
jgi:hypothetical protein